MTTIKTKQKVTTLVRTLLHSKKKKKKELSYDSVTPLLNIYPKELSRVLKRICTSMYSSNIHNSQKVEAIQVYTDRQMYKKKWYKHTTEYYLTLKRKEILTHVTTWMKLNDIMLSKISQSQKDKDRRFLGWSNTWRQTVENCCRCGYGGLLFNG